MDFALPNDFKELLSLLKDKDVKYLLIGAYAVGYYGYPRATNDIDFWVANRRDNAERIVAVIREFGFDVPELKADLFLKKNSLVRLGAPPMRIEITTGISGVSFDECYSERVVETIEGIEVNIISLKHLKENKKAAGRLKDLADLENLE